MKLSRSHWRCLRGCSSLGVRLSRLQRRKTNEETKAKEKTRKKKKALTKSKPKRKKTKAKKERKSRKRKKVQWETRIQAKQDYAPKWCPSLTNLLPAAWWDHASCRSPYGPYYKNTPLVILQKPEVTRKPTMSTQWQWYTRVQTQYCSPMLKTFLMKLKQNLGVTRVALLREVLPDLPRPAAPVGTPPPCVLGSSDSPQCWWDRYEGAKYLPAPPLLPPRSR